MQAVKGEFYRSNTGVDYFFGYTGWSWLFGMQTYDSYIRLNTSGSVAHGNQDSPRGTEIPEIQTLYLPSGSYLFFSLRSAILCSLSRPGTGNDHLSFVCPSCLSVS